MLPGFFQEPSRIVLAYSQISSGILPVYFWHNFCLFLFHDTSIVLLSALREILGYFYNTRMSELFQNCIQSNSRMLLNCFRMPPVFLQKTSRILQDYFQRSSEIFFFFWDTSIFIILCFHIDYWTLLHWILEAPRILLRSIQDISGILRISSGTFSKLFRDFSFYFGIPPYLF